MATRIGDIVKGLGVGLSSWRGGIRRARGELGAAFEVVLLPTC